MKQLIQKARALLKGDLAGRIFRAIAYGVGGAIGSKALMMLANILASKILGKEVYGQYSLVYSTVLTFVTISSSGINATMSRYVALHKHEPDKLGSIISSLTVISGVLALFVSLLLYLSADVISVWVSESSQLTLYFQLTSITVLFSSLASIQQGIYLGMERYRQSMTIQIIGNAIFLALVLLLSPTMGIIGAILALLAGFVCQFLLMSIGNLRMYKKMDIQVTHRVSPGMLQVLWSFTLPSYMAGIIVLPVVWFTNSMLSKFSGYGAMAVFSVAYQWMQIATFIPSQLGQMRPIYTDLFAQGRIGELRNIVHKTILTSSALLVPFVLLAVLFASFILGLYGEGYTEGTLVFSLMLMTALFINVQQQIGSVFQAVGRMWLAFVINFVWAVVLVVGYLLLKDQGALGLSIAYLIAYANHAVLSHLLLRWTWNKHTHTTGKDGETTP